MALSGGKVGLQIEVEKSEKSQKEILKAKRRAARTRRRRIKAIKGIISLLGYCLFAIGLGELGISVKTAEWWCLMLGLALYVTFND